MTSELNIVGICGSLRTHSHSRAVLQSITQNLPTGTVYSELDIGQMPHYNEDLDGGEPPTAIRAARDRVDQADAVILVTPEFNHGLPGVLKNALDWLSRPAFASCLVGKPAMFATISPGALGGVRAQYQMRETLSSMLCRLFPLMEIAVTHVNGKLENDRLVDEATIAHIRAVLDSFLTQADLRAKTIS